MKLLIVGASGFIGRNLVRAAADTRWEVYGTYWRAEDFPRFAREFGCSAIRYNLLGATKSLDADGCIYAAGNSSHLKSVQSPLEDLAMNLEALNRFLTGFSGGLVFMGSAAVYEGNSGKVSPDTRTDPQMPYAITKLASEQYIRHYMKRGTLEWGTILRLYYTYGPHDHPNRLIPLLIRAVDEGREVFPVTSAEGSLLDPLYVSDVAGAAIAAADGRAADRCLDLCGGSPRTVPEIIKEALDVLDSDMDVTTQPREGEVPVRFFSSPDACRSELGIGPFVPFATGLHRYREWLRI